MYAKGVAEGIISSADVSLETWVEANENEYKQMYQGGLKDDVYDASMSYEEWIKLNNYGQPPVVDETGKKCHKIPW
ncbi:hypothetical protein [Listeria monocytogenes]|uniref:hypothetical protein n=1 Tax=Listeria monocytogenes TaxID=1639 RepID=UPI001F3524AF|nr:hypothetical protein [Listeria monocytogenes]